jgi:hypothetical protein
MKSITVTFSIPESLNRALHSLVEKRGLSRFVAKAIEKALKLERDSLKAAYAAANNDPDRKKVIEDWNSLETEDWDG